MQVSECSHQGENDRDALVEALAPDASGGFRHDEQHGLALLEGLGDEASKEDGLLHALASFAGAKLSQRRCQRAYNLIEEGDVRARRARRTCSAGKAGSSPPGRAARATRTAGRREADSREADSRCRSASRINGQKAPSAARLVMLTIFERILRP